MTKIKRVLFFLLTIIICSVIYIERKPIIYKLSEIFRSDREIVILPGNGYQKKDSFLRVQQVNDYVPHNYDDLINIFYSTLNQGWKDFVFYCPLEYDNCLKDVAKLSDNKELLSEINNYVHPYNGYSTIKTLYDSDGKVSLHIEYLYNSEEIEKIDNEINRIMSNTLNNNMDTITKVKVLHNYIVNNTKYDKVREETNSSEYDSSRMTGLLFDGYAVCSGYADVMSVMLDKLNIKNFRISSSTHVWNAVFLNDKWYHLDVTWDDPVTHDGSDLLDYNYFLIDTDKLFSLDHNKNEHSFDENFYLEFKKD